MPLMRRTQSPSGGAAGEESARPPEDAAGAAGLGPPLEVPRDTTPTFELEMLVSGAVLFGLIQLPPVFTGALAWATPRMASLPARMFADTGIMLGRSIVYVLIATFVVHLASRAYWVAMVGLDSVFPAGIRWERRTGYGPAANEHLRAKIPPLPSLISRVDNFCSVVFAAGFSITFMAAFGILGAIAAILAVVLFTAFGLDPRRAATTVLPIFYIPLILALIDRRWGDRLRPDSVLARVTRGAGKLTARAFGVRWFAPMLLTLRTNLPRRFMVGIYAIFFGGIGLSMYQMFQSNGEVGLGAFADLPAQVGEQARQYLSYADQRTGDDASIARPFIQSDVVRDPYVRLFVPYDVRRDAAAMKRCPGAAAQAPAALHCLATIHSVSVNGQPRPNLDVRFYTDPASGLDGILVYIPVADLPRGRNVLQVRRAPYPLPNAPPGANDPVQIPFWL